MNSIGDDEACQALIPGLPDDVALRCLVKISHGYHGVLEMVSRKWRDAIRSSDYACLKAIEGWSGNWLFVFPAQKNDMHWHAYDPDADRWHPMPRMPITDSDEYNGFSCVTAYKRLLVIGGYWSSCSNQKPSATNTVMAFDPFKKQWSRFAELRTARTGFACAVVHDKVYVAGGSNLSSTRGLGFAEVYDPDVDRWEDLPQMPFALFDCSGVSYRGQFHIFGKKDGNVLEDSYIIFDPVEVKWHIVEDSWPFSKVTRHYMTVLNGQIYAIVDDEGTIKVLDTDQRTWRTIGSVPAVLLQNHNRPLKPFAFGFVGFQHQLYVVGGMALRFDSESNAFGIEKLNSARFCDILNLPVQWKDARSMSKPSGSIAVCVTLDE